MNRRKNIARPALSLLEVVLALTILTGAIAVLGELSRLGARNAGIARDMTQAQLLCESKLAEFTAGVSLPEIVQGASFPPDADPEQEWLFSVDLQPLSVAGLISVRLTVVQDLPAEQRPVEFSLVRWMTDPGYSLPVPDAEAQQALEQAAAGAP